MAENERRGFAGMNQEKQREIARKGGRAAHEKGTAHEFTREEAREAGRKGGEAVSRDREHMSRIGREGGLSSRGGQGRGDRTRVREGATSGEQNDQPETEEARERTGGG
jgi:hypothetical protein